MYLAVYTFKFVSRRNEKKHQITEETASELNKHNEASASAENQEATVSNLVKYIKQAWQQLDDDLYPPGEAQKLKKHMAGLLFHFKYDLLYCVRVTVLSLAVFQKREKFARR